MLGRLSPPHLRVVVLAAAAGLLGSMAVQAPSKELEFFCVRCRAANALSQVHRGAWADGLLPCLIYAPGLGNGRRCPSIGSYWSCGDRWLVVISLAA